MTTEIPLAGKGCADTAACPGFAARQHPQMPGDQPEQDIGTPWLDELQAGVSDPAIERAGVAGWSTAAAYAALGAVAMPQGCGDAA